MAAKRIFFSTSSNLHICFGGKAQMKDDGKKVAVGSRNIQFTECSDGYGRYETDDPEEIAFLDKRFRDAKAIGSSPDVFDHNEYSRRVTPPEVRESALQRTIEEQNKLIQQLQAQQASGGRKNAQA